MPPISEAKVKKIKEMILAFLFNNSPKSFYPFGIATEIARDEEFIKRLLHELMRDGLVAKISKNPKGIKYLRRERWRLTNKTFKAYSELQ